MITGNRLMHRLTGLAVLLSGTMFQSGGCNALTEEQFTVAVNGATQAFLNSLFRQWIDIRLDGLLNVG